MRARLLLAPLLVAACTGHSSAGPAATPTEENPCTGATPAPGCVSPTPTAEATAYPYPADAGHISPLPVPERFPGELVRKDNNLNPGVRTASVTVTVPAGKVLATDLICQGRGSVEVTTQPVSLAEQTITCDGSDVPSQLGAEAPTGEKSTRTYRVLLRATGPSRWFLAVSARAPQ